MTTNRIWLIVAIVIALGMLAPTVRGEESEIDQRQPQGKPPTQAATQASDPTLAAIGLLTGTASRCTAFLVGSDRVVVTAAHCVLDRDGKPSQARFAFRPGYRAGAHTPAFDAHVVVTGGWKPTGDPRLSVEPVADDWAILATDQPTGIAPLTLAGDLKLDQLRDRPLASVGYSVDVASGRFVTEDVPCRATHLQDLRIDHTCRGSLGAAGSPLFLLGPTDARGALVGLVVQGAASSTAERLVIGQLMGLADVRGIPAVDYGGRAVFSGAFVNAVKIATAGAELSAMK